MAGIAARSVEARAQRGRENAFIYADSQTPRRGARGGHGGILGLRGQRGSRSPAGGRDAQSQLCIEYYRKSW